MSSTPLPASTSMDALRKPLNFLFLSHNILLPAKSRVSNPSKKIRVSRIRVSHDKPRNPTVSEELQKEALEVLEWPSVCGQISAFSSTAAGRSLCRVGGLRIGRSRRESEGLLLQTQAAASLPAPLDFSGVDDVEEIVRMARDGVLLSIRQLCAVERSLRSARAVLEQLEAISCSEEGSSERYYPLLDILQNCDFLTELADTIGFCVDCTLSTIPDRASSKLKSIRSERKENMEKLDSLLKEVSLKVFQAGGIDSPLVTKRRSRMCVGIRASHKSLLSEGIVLSISSSGATYFMEPRDAVDLNNMEVRLSSSERAEELAILSFLTSEVADSDLKIKHLMQKIMELDLACARGAYAVWMNGVCPVFVEDKETVESKDKVMSVDIEGIHHPLLIETSLVSKNSKMLVGEVDSQSVSKSCVPLDIKIRHSTKVVVISGPNTGGKTATMKTLGLASLMSKAGIFLPAKNQPKLPWFDQILADIGDHQSLEHNLSTFSGHIARLCKIIDVVSEESLVLLDEIGSGTDPSEGVALSTSILQHLASCVNLAMVTTHYADLSRLETTDSRFENAAMEFCMETLKPTYRILWGSTGNSNALTIAKSIGFDEEVLNRALEWVEKLAPDKQTQRHSVLYQSLLEERSLLEAQANEAALVLSQVKELHLEIQSEAEDLDNACGCLKG
ncbi:uncharacterized protein M6B38_149825 [Iris pallida]|uniref:DNA mismatch repair proteins mutS family domain-containing protein n=1 Tax=Iris pallida TaxID=29817 RepID=A0AAX6F7B7_IRIPA|nr:uncharacterized protein M6B38_149825 [Iris pallida]